MIQFFNSYSHGLISEHTLRSGSCQKLGLYYKMHFLNPWPDLIAGLNQLNYLQAYVKVGPFLVKEHFIFEEYWLNIIIVSDAMIYVYNTRLFFMGVGGGGRSSLRLSKVLPLREKMNENQWTNCLGNLPFYFLKIFSSRF